MSIQKSTTLRDAQNDAWESTIGTAAKLQIWTGSVPANCAAAATGTKLVEMSLPSDYMAASSSGVKSLLGTWSGTGLAAGTAGYFRITNTAASTCHVQGTVGIGGSDMNLDNTNIAVGQVVSVTSFTVTASGA